MNQQSPYPQTSPPESASAALMQAADRRRKWRRVVIISLLTLLVLPLLVSAGVALAPRLFGDKFALTDDELEAAKVTVARAKAEGERRPAAIRQSLTRGLGELAPGDAPCPHQLGLRASRYATDQGAYEAEYSLTVTAPADLPRVSVAGDLTWKARNVEEQLGGFATTRREVARLRDSIAQLDALLASSAPSEFEVVLVTAAGEAPLPMPKGYIPGWTLGRAFLIDVASAEVACVGDVMVQSSPDIKYRTALYGPNGNRDAAAALKRDLALRQQAAIPDRMRLPTKAGLPFKSLANFKAKTASATP